MSTYQFLEAHYGDDEHFAHDPDFDDDHEVHHHSRRKTFVARALAKVKEKARIEIFVIAILNFLIALIFMLMKIVDVCITVGWYTSPTPSYYLHYIGQYAVHDREVYYSKNGRHSGETLSCFINVCCDIFAFLVYLIGSILLFLAELRIIRVPRLKIIFATCFILSCVLCGFFSFVPKWITWGMYNHFIHDGEYLVVCNPAIPIWGHMAGIITEKLESKKLNKTFTAARSMSLSTASSAANFAKQCRGGFSPVFKKLYGKAGDNCECVMKSKGEVMSAVHGVNIFLASSWIIVILIALWFMGQVKHGNPEYVGVVKKVTPTPDSNVVEDPQPSKQEPAAAAVTFTEPAEAPKPKPVEMPKPS